jgi:dimethylhistidine N-methyltransferase
MDKLFINSSTDLGNFRADVLHGLMKYPKEIPCKYLYDERGSLIFDLLCRTREYYVSRCELSVLRRNLKDIVTYLGRKCALVELGSGSSMKTRLFLNTLDEPSGYLPVDISLEHLYRTTQALKEEYPHIPIVPVEADFTKSLNLLPCLPDTRFKQVIYFPGSTLGNFAPMEALDFLNNLVEISSPFDGLLIGIDLKKDRDVLIQAYNDRRGLTAAFNLNVLKRINRQLGADFALDKFLHYAFFNETLSRVEMHLLSVEEQKVHLDEYEIPFYSHETIHTESSYKYSIEEFTRLVQLTSWKFEKVWTDQKKYFGLFYFSLR